VQLAPRQHGLQQVPRVHRALRLAGADDVVQLVDEQEDLPLALFDFRQHGLQAFLKLAPELRARDERPHVQGKDGAVLQAVRHVAARDALGEAFRDGGLPHAGLANEHRVVLGFPAQDPDDVPDLRVAPDHRVKFLAVRKPGQVDAVLVQRVIAVLGRVAGDARRAAHFAQYFQEIGLPDLKAAEEGADRAVRRAQEPQEQVLDGDVLVLHLIGRLRRLPEGAVHLLGDIGLALLPDASLNARQALHLIHGALAEFLRCLAHAGEQQRDQRAVLFQQCCQQMRLLKRLVGVLAGQCACPLDDFRALLRVSVRAHDVSLRERQRLTIFDLKSIIHLFRFPSIESGEKLGFFRRIDRSHPRDGRCSGIIGDALHIKRFSQGDVTALSLFYLISESDLGCSIANTPTYPAQAVDKA